MKSKILVSTLVISMGALYGCNSDSETNDQSACPESNAENTITLCVTSLPENHPTGDMVYLAGSMNGWNAGGDEDKEIILQDNGNGTFSYDLEFTDDVNIHQFKFTRGDWDSVEIDSDGYDLGNRAIEYNGEYQVVELEIAKWADLEGGSLGGRPTVVGNLELLTVNNFPIDDEERTIRVWLPESYDPDREQPFPVIYAWDGQNLFDESSSNYGMEWQIDETLTELGAEYVVIGLDSPAEEYNGVSSRKRRYIEYTAFDWEHSSDGLIESQGDETVDYVVDELIPLLETSYNIGGSAENRVIMGSSLGGYMSLFAINYRPEVFGTALALSHMTGDMRGGEALRQQFLNHGFSPEAHIYLDMGDQETVGSIGPDSMLAGHNAMLAVFDTLDIQVEHAIIEGGLHDEESWAERFPSIFQLMLE